MNNIGELTIIAIPTNKKWWQFWRLKRKLKNGRDYNVLEGTVTFKKQLKGLKIECFYTVSAGDPQ